MTGPISGPPQGVYEIGAPLGVVASDGVLRDEFLDLAGQHDRQARIALRFAADNAGHILHVRGLGWLVWDGARFAPSEALVQDRLLATLRRLRLEAMSFMSQESAELLKLVRSCESASAIDGVLRIASRLRGLAATVDDLDADAYLLNTPGGTIDLRTMTLRPHDPADLITKVTRGSWDPASPTRSPLWEDFLDEVLPDPEVRGFLQRMEGMALLGAVPEAVFPIFTGTGANGKSVEMGALSHTLGDYASTAEDGLFEVQRSSNPHGPTPALAKLRGVRRLGSSELADGARINAPLMKRLTGGDRIAARELHGHPFEFTPAFTPMMLTNFLPKLPANDPAVWRRVVVVPFTVVIPEARRDPNLPAKLEQHADAILAWALEGWRSYSAHGLMRPSAVIAATGDYAEAQDDVRRFVDAWCDELAGGDLRSQKTTTLHEAYRRWAQAEGVHIAHVLGKTKFAQRLDALGLGSVKTRSGMVHPLRLNEAAE